MKDEMNFDEFEKFLQDEVSGIKIYPSDNVWKNIAKETQPKRSWPALTLISVFVLLSISTATYMNYPPENAFTKIALKDTLNGLRLQNTPAFEKKAKKTSVGTLAGRTNDTEVGNVVHNNEGAVVANQALQNNPTSINLTRATDNNLSTNEINALVTNGTTGDKGIAVAEGEGDIKFEMGEWIFQENKNLAIREASLLNNGLGSKPSLIEPNSLYDDDSSEAITKTTDAHPLGKRLSYDIYTTPSISYRILEEDNIFNQSSTGQPSVNSQVNHIAALGSEFGLGLRYKIADNISLKTGGQFNIRQYYIVAYANNGGAATIPIVQNNKVDSIKLASNYSNRGTNAQTRLNNRLYQVSAPLGIQWGLYSKNNFSFGISASIQPTYAFNNNVYVISTDFKNYVFGSSFFRKWNINSSISTDFSYKLKKSTIYFGPQVRYQHLSTYLNVYSIKEYRIDYGIKVGILNPF